MMSYTVTLNTEREKDTFIHCQQLEALIQGKCKRGDCYPYTIEQAEDVAKAGEALGCWV